MEESILKSVKAILGLSADYTAYDTDVITFINGAFARLTEVGVGPNTGFSISDDSALWSTYALETGTEWQLNNVKTFVQLKTRLAFDPPSASFHVKAMEDQIKQLEFGLQSTQAAAKYTPEEAV